jgi:deoxyribose-phosphate aldolase
LEINRLIDHTELRPEQPFGRYTELCREAIFYKFSSVCINSFFIPLVYNILKNHPENGINVCSVIGFPFGTNDINSKCVEVHQAVGYGASELDVVVNISAVKTGDYKRVEDELSMLREASQGKVLKLILEVGVLTTYEIQRISEIAIALNYNYLKTSTGVNVKLPFEETLKYSKILVELTKNTALFVKASGGIKTLDQCRQLIDCGVKRIGTSNGVAIMQELQGEK